MVSKHRHPIMDRAVLQTARLVGACGNYKLQRPEAPVHELASTVRLLASVLLLLWRWRLLVRRRAHHICKSTHAAALVVLRRRPAHAGVVLLLMGL